MKFVKNCPWGEYRKLPYLYIVAGISQMGKKPPKNLKTGKGNSHCLRLRNFTLEHNQTQQFLPKGTASPTRIVKNIKGKHASQKWSKKGNCKVPLFSTS